MYESNKLKKNELEEKCEYLSLKERRERLINYFLIILIIVYLVFSIVYINSIRFKPNEEIAYTNPSSNETKSDNSFIRFIYDGFNHNNPPSKKEYIIDSVSCNNAKGYWDSKKWQLYISNIVDKVSCSLSFKKKESVITHNNSNKKVVVKNNNKLNTVNNGNEIIKEELLYTKIDEETNSISTNEEEIKGNKEEIILNLDKCESIEDCNYKVVMDSNFEVVLKPNINGNNYNDSEIEYELLSGSNAINLYNGGIICSKNVVDEVAYVKLSVKANKQLNTIVKVIVEAKRLNTRVYDINRHNQTINKIELNTNIQTFINNIMNNKKNIHVYDTNNNEIKDNNKLIVNGMKVKLIIDNKIYDELEIIVLGDIDGDGKCTNNDYNMVNEYLMGNIELKKSQFLAADCNKNGIVDSLDYELIYRYLTNLINSFIVT